MKKNYLKLISIFLSIAISELTNLNVNAQTWRGENYYIERDPADTKSDKEIDEMNFDYDLVMNWLTYKKLCCFDVGIGVDNWFPIAIYTSVDRAIYQYDAINYENFYLPIANSIFKDVYQLVDGRPSLIEDINLLDEIDKNNLSFSLVQVDSNGNEQIVGFVNGKDMIAMANPCLKYYQKEKQLKKIK